ncbi:gibberellin 2-beta-dioxygenase 2 [Beta vulgaris subsp. vulgaris]|uniref:gibberellin 2-beta-dioxygenase 2 n=1 Tax=Beta vulgaris subsp. vulgaris TaxID=3555 RepID=UPI0020367695|nr:gibberellin 2-beta-dioxygenase 2 [Beta vulgaris subsp. vulgaris]
MVVSSPNPLKRTKKTKAVGVPTIDLSLKYEDRLSLSDLIVEACEEFGIFKVINHGISSDIISSLEKHGLDFFAMPSSEKHLAVGPNVPKPFGYGFRNIGNNGDVGDLEYLLLHANLSSTRPPVLSDAVDDYVGAVTDLTCELLDLMAEGMWVPDKTIFSRLIRDVQSDSLLRLNHYPPLENFDTLINGSNERIGFGEHSDPQILTILRSNDVGGLQISMPDGLWVPVHPDPNAFYVMVGDALQVLTNGRFESVKHRAMANNSASKARMSMIYFGAPPINATISPIQEMVSPMNPSLYTPFTWGEYKRAMHTSRLSDCRLNLFKRRNDQ